MNAKALAEKLMLHPEAEVYMQDQDHPDFHDNNLVVILNNDKHQMPKVIWIAALRFGEKIRQRDPIGRVEL